MASFEHRTNVEKMVEDYAAHTRGLPKTDFDGMREMAHGYIDRTVNPRGTSTEGGVDTGQDIAGGCFVLEQTLEEVKFNAFAGAREPGSMVQDVMESMVIDLSYTYLMRQYIRNMAHPMELEYAGREFMPPMPTNEEVKSLFTSLSELARQKDAEYGASWCKRGGIGAWFTTVRKFDRLVTQLTQKGNNIWDVSDDINSTESLEETIKDGINYLLLILEKRRVISQIEAS